MTPKLALSVRQPWAWLIFHGKDVENRNWRLPPSFKLPQRIIIHASRTKDAGDFESAFWVFGKAGFDLPVMSANHPLLAYGALIGEVDITDCIRKSFSPWFEGPFGFVLRNSVAYEHPIPCKGRHGFWEVPDSVVLPAASGAERAKEVL